MSIRPHLPSMLPPMAMAQRVGDLWEPVIQDIKTAEKSRPPDHLMDVQD